MISLTVIYHYDSDKNFDSDYYFNKHLPLVNSVFGDLLKGRYVEVGLAGGDENTPPHTFAITHLKFESLAQLMEAKTKLGPLIADIPNFTDVIPILQVSEVRFQ